MLVLTRGPEQSILINDNIRVTVLSIRGGRVRLGIVAPEDVPVDREEVVRFRAQFHAGTTSTDVPGPAALAEFEI